MKIESLWVENIKCQGCMNTITQAVKAIPHVQDVSIDAEKEIVEVTGDDAMDRIVIANTLSKLGYPEHGKNTFGKKARSYVSCAIGRMDIHPN